MRGTTSENLAEYYSLRDWRLKEIEACSDARHEAFPRLSLGLQRVPSGRSLSLPWLSRALKKANVVTPNPLLASMSVRCEPIT